MITFWTLLIIKFPLIIKWYRWKCRQLRYLSVTYLATVNELMWVLSIIWVVWVWLLINITPWQSRHFSEKYVSQTLHQQFTKLLVKLNFNTKIPVYLLHWKGLVFLVHWNTNYYRVLKMVRDHLMVFTLQIQVDFI